MKKVNLNFKIKDLDGNEKVEANKAMAGLLMHQRTGDAVKYFDWAMRFNKGEVIEVDNSDFSKIKDMVANNEDYLTMISKAQILIRLEEIKNEPEKAIKK